MHSSYLAPDDWSDSSVKLCSDEAKHLVSVLRARVNDEIRLFDGRGRAALARIESITGKGKSTDVSCLILKELPVQLPSTRLTLLQALPKGNRMDFLVEKAAELGVWRLSPLLTERVVKQAGAKGYSGQVERWNRVAMSAAKQCGSSWLPEIEQVSELSSALKRSQEADLALVCVLDREAQSLGSCLEKFGRKAEDVFVLIGPEGDLTQEEIDSAVDAGARPVSFGGLVLRVETAAIYAASVLKNHFQWDSWPVGSDGNY